MIYFLVDGNHTIMASRAVVINTHEVVKIATGKVGEAGHTRSVTNRAVLSRWHVIGYLTGSYISIVA